MTLQYMFVEQRKPTLLAGDPWPGGCLLLFFFRCIHFVKIQAGTDPTNEKCKPDKITNAQA
jgi:hypothetical protein